MRTVLIALGLGLCACDEPLARVEYVDHARVLAARVESDDDAALATPLPGGGFATRWLVAAPEGAVPTSGSLTACVPELTSVGLPRCAEPAFAELQVTPSTEPLAAFTAPGDASAVVVTADFCAGGALEPDGVCEPAGAPLAATLRIDLAADGRNLNPSLQDDALTLSNGAWSSDAGCGSGAPDLRADGRKVAVRWTSRGGDREPSEALTASVFVTAGKVAHSVAVIESSDVRAEPSAAFEWELPRRSGAPETEWLWLVVRDGRGGSDFVRRGVCLTP